MNRAVQGRGEYALKEKLNDKYDELSEAVTDKLTGTYHYNTFICRLKEDMSDDRRNLAVIYADIRNFRYINEHFGYSMGDKLLKLFCELMGKRQKGFIYSSRVYSDNIVVVCGMDNEKSLEENLGFIQAGINEVSAILQGKFMNRKVSVCSGVCVIDRDVADAETAVSNANLARKEAKKRKNVTMVVYENELKANYNHKMKLASDLPSALKSKEIKVFYQPKIESMTGKIAGGEALVRWQKPDGTFIYPNDFIPYFEESGLIVDVDFYVYNEVFSSIRNRLDRGLSVVPVSMNISRVHLESENLILYIKSLFSKYKISPEYVEFELTESVYMENYENALKLITELRKMGVKISMDDFGSGYSSLNMLNNIPIDVLKIDKVFLGKENKSLEESQKIIIRAVIEMASKLHMRTVCEGVESSEQNEFLTSIGCDMIQGFFYQKPMPESDFYDYLTEYENIC